MKRYTLVTFILYSETISRYFEGLPTFDQINAMTGFSPIIDIQRCKGSVMCDYVKAKNIHGYTAA